MKDQCAAIRYEIADYIVDRCEELWFMKFMATLYDVNIIRQSLAAADRGVICVRPQLRITRGIVRN